MSALHFISQKQNNLVEGKHLVKNKKTFPSSEDYKIKLKGGYIIYSYDIYNIYNYSINNLLCILDKNIKLKLHNWHN